MKKVVSKSFKQTQDLGMEFAKNLWGGEVIALHGDLGSGKTTFVQGLAKGLGITQRIISPTFIIMKNYRISLPHPTPSLLKGEGRSEGSFYHVDLYRIESEKDVEGLGLLEIMQDSDSIVVIEWPEKIEHLLLSKRKNLVFNYIDENKREIIFE